MSVWEMEHQAQCPDLSCPVAELVEANVEAIGGGLMHWMSTQSSLSV